MIAEAGCLGIMTGNNLTNGLPLPDEQAAHRRHTPPEYGFKGCHDRLAEYGLLSAAAASGAHVGRNAAHARKRSVPEYVLRETAGSAERSRSEALLERMIYPTLYALFETGVYERDFNDPSLFARFEGQSPLRHGAPRKRWCCLQEPAEHIAAQTGQRILLTGTDEIHSGTGSGFVKGYDHVSYEQGLRAVYGDDLICQTDPDRETVRKADVVLFRLNKPAGEGLTSPMKNPQTSSNGCVRRRI